MTRHCIGNSGAHVEDGRQLDCAGCVLVDNSIQVEACMLLSLPAWHGHSSSLWFQSHSGWLSLPRPVWLEYSSPGCQPQSGWHSLPCSIWFKHLTLEISFPWLSPKAIYLEILSTTISYTYMYMHTHVQIYHLMVI